MKPNQSFFDLQCMNEKLVADALDRLGVRYQTQRTMIIGRDLVYADFYLPDYNLLLEVQSPNHYAGWDQEKLKRQKARDKRLRNWARVQGYKLHEMRWTEVRQAESYLAKLLAGMKKEARKTDYKRRADSNFDALLGSAKEALKRKS